MTDRIHRGESRGDRGTVGGEPRFDDPIERRHDRIDPDAWRDIYVVGDVHGCYAELERLLSELAATEEDLVLYVGDLVRKGPESERVVDLVRRRPNMRSVRGNNEQMIVDGAVEELSETRAFLETFPLAISVGESLVVHGGVDPRKPLGDQTPRDLLEVRSLAREGGYERPYWFEEYRGPPRVFFGHTVLSAPHDGEWAVGLDTGCVHGGALTAVDLRTGEFHAVPAERVYRARAEETIASPTEPAGPRKSGRET